MTAVATSRTNPFPGLRPFEENEDDLFFGRDAQIDDLVGRLRRHRLIAVIGTSGSGKSSLVRAGLLPALHGGFMAGVGSRWRVATMRPGNAPIANLAAALDAAGLTGAPETDRETRVGLARAGLDRGSLGLVDVLRDSDLAKNENVLLLVDQFEELFRFQQDNSNEAAAFVKILLTACESADVPVYVVLTMRSDFLGDCAQFDELAQHINDGLFLVPRMTWDQLREAIEMPVRAAGADIQPALVTRLLNDLGDNPDQLPVLQHALMRTWDLRADSGEPMTLTLEDLARTGGLENALSLHGDAVLATLDAGDRVATEKLFKCITELGSDNRGIRRPTRFGQICAVTNTSFADMNRVVEAFRAPECSFLAVRSGPLTETTVIDIAHEGLMRLWKPLVVWVEEEARSAQLYRRLATAASLHAEHRAALYRNPELQITEQWRADAAPNAAWSRLVDPRIDFTKTMTFLDASVAERTHERAVRARSIRFTIGGLAVLVLIMAAITAFAVKQTNFAEKERVATLVAQSRFLTRDANAALDRGDAVTAMLLALEAQRTAGADAPPEAEYALQSALANQQERLDLRGHTDVVEGVGFSPDGRRIVSGGGDRTIRVWDAKTGAQLALMHGHKGFGVSWATFSPDGRQILTSGDRIARFWNASTYKPLGVINGPDNVESATYSPDGRRIVMASDDKTVRVFDITSKRQLAVMRGHTGMVNFAAFSPDGKRAVSASADKTVRTWDAQTGAPLHVLRGHTAATTSAVYSPDGSRIASASIDGSVRVWDAKSGALITVLSVNPAGVSAVTFSRDGHYLLACGVDGTIRIWDGRDLHSIETLSGHDGNVTVAQFSPDSKQIVSGSFDRSVRVWDVVSHSAPSVVLRGHTGPVYYATFSPDGKRVLTSSFDHTARVWDAAGKQLAAFPGPKGVIGDYSPDGRRILAVSSPNMKLWDAVTFKKIATYRGASHVTSVHFAPDGRAFVIASTDGSAHIWNAVNGKLIAKFSGSNDILWNARYSPDGKFLTTASNDNTARIYNVATGKRLLTLRGHEGPVYSSAFSPDGTRLATASLDRTIRIWDVASGHQLLVLYGHQAGVPIATWSPDGTRIASGSLDHSIRIWDAKTGLQMSVFSGHDSFVYDTEFSPDGKRLASASDDKTARIWQLVPQPQGKALANAARAAAPRTLTKLQRAQEFLPDTSP